MALRFVTALSAALSAMSLSVAPALAEAPCGQPGYSYAGLQSLTPAYGVGAALTALGTPLVENGHVAAWVGVGGPGEGPRGSDEWLQAGLNSVPGSGNKLYYEVARPGVPIRYAEIDANVPTGAQRKVAVLEMAHHPDHWRVWIDGLPVTAPIYLPASHRTLTPMATAESWDGGSPSCNLYSYRFGKVVLAERAGGAWSLLRRAYLMQDPGYRVVRRESAFLASALRPLPPGQ